MPPIPPRIRLAIRRALEVLATLPEGDPRGDAIATTIDALMRLAAARVAPEPLYVLRHPHLLP
jgi:hypothetical protein